MARLDSDALDHVDGHLCQAALCSQIGQHAEALSWLMRALERTASFAQCLIIQQTIIQLGRAADVAGIIRLSDRHDSIHSERLKQRLLHAHLLWQSGHYAQALIHYEAYSRLMQSDSSVSTGQVAEALLVLSRAQLRMGVFAVAEQNLDALIDQQTGHPWHCSALELKNLCGLGGDSNVSVPDQKTIVCQSDCPVAARDRARRHIVSQQAFDTRALSARDQISFEGAQRLLERYPQASSIQWHGLDAQMLHTLVNVLPDKGIIVECGVYFGRSIRLMSEWTDRPIAGFDSFEGLPESWGDREPAGAYSTGGQQPEFTDQVSLYPGWFCDSLPEFVQTTQPEIALLHLDCDLYTSSMDCVTHLQHSLVDGAIVLFDDLLGYPGYKDHEWRALEEWQDQLQNDQRGCLQPISAVIMDRAVAFRWHQ